VESFLNYKNIAFLGCILLASCASIERTEPSVSDGAIDFTRSEYLNILSLNPIETGMQKLRPTYAITNEAGYQKFRYNFEMESSSRISDAYQAYCSSKGGQYLSPNWKVGLCSKSESVKDSLFFVQISPVQGFDRNFRFVNLLVFEPTGNVSREFEELVNSRGYVSSEQLRKERRARMNYSDAQRAYYYKRTVGSQLCKLEDGEDITGFVEKVTPDKFQIRLLNQNLIWDSPSAWRPC